VVFPEAVNPSGHYVVHAVVGGCDGGEDLGDWWKIWLEIGLLCGSRSIEGARGIPLSAFFDSATVWNPKWVVFSVLDAALSCCCNTTLLEEKHRCCVWGSNMAPSIIRGVSDGVQEARLGTIVPN